MRNFFWRVYICLFKYMYVYAKIYLYVLLKKRLFYIDDTM